MMVDDILLAMVMVWLVENTDYEMPEEPPIVEFVEDICMAAGGGRPCGIDAAYNPINRTIYIDQENWENDPFEKPGTNQAINTALLIHEVTHYLQDMTHGMPKL